MKISIVTISYNQGPYLKECIKSVIGQDYNELEYIVVDAGSTDESRNIIRKYTTQIEHAIFETDQGPADGLNKGFGFASGEIFGFINADDFLLPGCLVHVAAYFQNNPDIDILHGNGILVDHTGKKMRDIYTTKLSLKRYVYGTVVLMQQATFFRKAAFEKIGGFNKQNKTCWDGEAFLDMLMAGSKTAKINRCLAGFRIHRESISGSGSENESYILDRKRLFRKAMGRDKSAIDTLLAIPLKGDLYIRRGIAPLLALIDNIVSR